MNGQLVCFDAHDAVRMLMDLILFVLLIGGGVVLGLSMRAGLAEWDLARLREKNERGPR